MRALIFAAGMGTRISRHIGDWPKCLVNVYGMPLINYTIKLLKSRGIHDIAVVTGYKGEQVERLLPRDVQVFRNPFFSVTNSIASLWFARSFIDPSSPLLAMNGDVFMEEAILDELLEAANCDKFAVMVADSSRIYGADYKFYWKDGCLRRYGKDLEPHETSGEYVGVGLVPRRNVEELVESVQQEVMAGNYNKWWEEAIYMKSSSRNVGILDISGNFWVELDFVEDLNKLNNYVRQSELIPAE
jgi:L-glutamine-phosphate cytidylyltransferase